MDLLRGIRARVYPVGRLDYASEGLLILTNDGDLAYRLMKAASHVPKVYVVKVAGKPEAAGIERLRRGLTISSDRFGAPKGLRNNKSAQSESVTDAKAKPARQKRTNRGGGRVHTAPAKVRIVREADNPWYELTLMEGKNRQIRRMFEEIGHHVEKIKRVRYGPLSLDIPPGEFRRLSTAEVEKLKAVAAVEDVAKAAAALNVAKAVAAVEDVAKAAAAQDVAKAVAAVEGIIPANKIVTIQSAAAYGIQGC